jgi:hypothetical protein
MLKLFNHCMDDDCGPCGATEKDPVLTGICDIGRALVRLAMRKRQS